MWDKIKAFLSNVWAVVVLVLGGALGIMLYFLKAKQREINALNAKIDLADTHAKADLIQADINQRLQNKDLLQKEVTELNNSLDALAEKRKQITANESAKTPQEAEDFWNKKN
jgi:hypothetical protein